MAVCSISSNFFMVPSSLQKAQLMTSSSLLQTISAGKSSWLASRFERSPEPTSSRNLQKAYNFFESQNSLDKRLFAFKRSTVLSQSRLGEFGVAFPAFERVKDDLLSTLVLIEMHNRSELLPVASEQHDLNSMCFCAGRNSPCHRRISSEGRGIGTAFRSRASLPDSPLSSRQ